MEVTDSGRNDRTADFPSTFAGADADDTNAAAAHRGPDTHGVGGYAHTEVCKTRAAAASDVSARWTRWTRRMRRAVLRTRLEQKSSGTPTGLF